MLEYFKELASKYNISIYNVLSIALNRYGIIMNNVVDSRIRFNLKFNGKNDLVFFAVCVNTFPNSPFFLDNQILYLEGKPIANILNIYKDTCTATYFRNNNKAITFNSNARSKCKGCKFCGTYNLTADDKYDFSNSKNIVEYFNKLLISNGVPSMNDIEDITICTGCFDNEDALINHLIIVNDALKSMDFNGRINYIGSQLRSFDKIKLINDELHDFGLYLTIEKFLERQKIMKKEKYSLTLSDAKELLSYCSSLNITTTFLYILGLEDIDVIKKYFNFFKGSINKFPIVQVFQNYSSFQEKYRCDEAKSIEYYLKAKQEIEKIFSKTNLKPRLWECYRSLYYDDKSNSDSKCLIKKS